MSELLKLSSPGMSEKWIGSIISVDCGDVLGIFEGEISNVDPVNQTISLINVSRNSQRCQVPEVTLSTLDIRNLKLLESTANKNNSTYPVSASASVNPVSAKNGCITGLQLIDDNQKKKGEGKKKTPKGKKWMKERDEDCFSAPVDSEVLDIEFDFEKNLALFDKRAVFDEINALSRADHVRLVDCNKRAPAKYRHDENILNNDVPLLKQISVPCKKDKEYVTDSGLVIPSVTVEFKKLLYEKGVEAGQMPKVRVEMIGRAACEMVLHLVGGSHRLNPQNNHQRPAVVVLCGSHIQGAQGVNCGRHLANHCAIVTVLSPPHAKDSHSIIASELKLFNFSCGKNLNSVSALSSSVDLIVNALDSYDEPKPEEKAWLIGAKRWAKQSKAPILCLDPPPNCTTAEHNFILSPALPFAFKDNNIHICDIGLPEGVFTSIGCTYSSPFGSKFVIPLYSRTESI